MMKSRDKLRALTIACLLIAMAFFGGYWLKCQCGLDFIKYFHLIDYLPIRGLQKNDDSIISSDSTAVLLDDYFEGVGSQRNWNKLWARENGKIVMRYSPQGINESKCLFIKNTSEKDWAYQHKKLIETKTGDVFGFKGFVRTKGKDVWATMGVILYNSDRGVVNWYYATERVGESSHWAKLERHFMIPEGVRYVAFTLTGGGIGSFWFDNVKFYRENTRMDYDKDLAE